MRIEMRTSGEAAGVEHGYSNRRTEVISTLETTLRIGPVVMWAVLETSQSFPGHRPFVHAWTSVFGHTHRTRRIKPS